MPTIAIEYVQIVSKFGEKNIRSLSVLFPTIKRGTWSGDSDLSHERKERFQIFWTQNSTSDGSHNFFSKLQDG